MPFHRLASGVGWRDIQMLETLCLQPLADPTLDKVAQALNLIGSIARMKTQPYPIGACRYSRCNDGT